MQTQWPGFRTSIVLASLALAALPGCRQGAQEQPPAQPTGEAERAEQPGEAAPEGQRPGMQEGQQPGTQPGMQEGQQPAAQPGQQQPGMQEGQQRMDAQVFAGQLQPINQRVTNAQIAGSATFTVREERVTMAIDAQNVPTGVTHPIHVHGFKDGKDARCPTMQDDANGDGIIDATEAKAAVGEPMIPLSDDPTKMDGEPSFAENDEQALTYNKVVQKSELASALQSQRQVSDMMLDKRVVMIHGVARDAQLPETVQAEGGKPAHEMIPIACAELNQAEGGEGQQRPGQQQPGAEQPGQQPPGQQPPSNP